jgi:hypothetical protein
MKVVLLKLVHICVLRMMTVIWVYAVVSQREQFHILNTCKSDLCDYFQRPIRLIPGPHQLAEIIIEIQEVGQCVNGARVLVAVIVIAS